MLHHSERPTDDEITDTVNTYSNMLFKLSFTILANCADSEDAVSDTFLKYITKAPKFIDEEHKKAWLIRVGANSAKDIYRAKKRHSWVNIDDINDLCVDKADNDIIREMLSLPEKYKTVLHLHYVEGYSCEEISRILTVSSAAVRKRMQYGRDMLKGKYEEDLK